MSNGVHIPACLQGIDWHIVRDVCVFTEHKLGNELFDKARLKRISDTVNHKTYSLGRPPTLTSDHISILGADGKVHVKSSDEFTVYGFSVGHRVKDQGGRSSIFGDWLIYPEHVESVAQCPHRSIEWLKDQTGEFFDPIAVTKQTPRLELGVILPVDYYSGKVPSSRQGSESELFPHLTAYTLQGGRVLYTWREGSDMTPELKSGLTEVANKLLALAGTEAAPAPVVVPKVETFTADRTTSLSPREIQLEAENRKLKEDLLKTTQSAQQSERYTVVRELQGIDPDTFMKRWGDKDKDTFDNAVNQVRETYTAARGSGGITPLHGANLGSGLKSEDLLEKAAQIVERATRDGKRLDSWDVAQRLQQGEKFD